MTNSCGNRYTTAVKSRAPHAIDALTVLLAVPDSLRDPSFLTPMLTVSLVCGTAVSSLILAAKPNRSGIPLWPKTAAQCCERCSAALCRQSATLYTGGGSRG